MSVVTPISGETVTKFTNGILLDQGKQSIRLGTGLYTPSATICYANSNEIIRISSNVGIGTYDTESHLLKVDNGSAICGISLGSITQALSANSSPVLQYSASSTSVGSGKQEHDTTSELSPFQSPDLHSDDATIAEELDQI